MSAIVLGVLLLSASPAWSQEAEEFLSARGCITWAQCISFELWHVRAWESATHSEFEKCSLDQTPLTLLRYYPRPSDGFYCQFWSLYKHARNNLYLLVKAGLLFNRITCEWYEEQPFVRAFGLTCAELEREFDPFTGSP